ncbi:MAG: asparagine synthase (glutamine-hydrolyzing) [Caldilineaceae bacterium]
MCGICGILDGQRRVAPIGAMNQTQAHRGPDDEGYIFINTTTHEWAIAGGASTPAELDLISHDLITHQQYDLAFGSRRLAILDLSPAGHMPMSYAHGNLWITYNGEIYNYRELRAELCELGHHFASNTDTEVILAAYAEWGTNCLTHFNGMFAFAIWDARRQQLFCARDRFGIKPFYYFRNQQTFIFASEIKALVAHPLVPRQPNDQTIFDYLVLGLSDHTELTFFDDILSLSPGHFLVLDVHEAQLYKERWWDTTINPSMEIPPKAREEQTYREFAELLEDAVRLRLRSDVPVGSCLSGGLDSSAIVCLANRLLLNEQVIPGHIVGDHQKTFTASYRGLAIDEHKYSKLVIQQTGAEENLVFPQADILWSEVERFVWQMDEPVGSTSQYAQWNVMRLASERGVTVLLDGQGGDEVLGGYHAYYLPYISQIKQHRGSVAAMRAAWAASRVSGAPVRNMLVENVKHRLPWRLQQAINAIKPPRPPSQGGTGVKFGQLTEEFVQQFSERHWQPFSGVDASGLVGVLYQDLTSTNLPKLLRYEDRNSMSFSREARLPFLDFRLVEMVFSLPLYYRINQGWSKWILRRSLQNLLPKEICWRRSKLGYPTPELSWLRQGSGYIRHLFRQHESSPILAAYLRPGLLQQISELPDNELLMTPGLWRLINLIIWFDLYFEGNARPTDEQFSVKPLPTAVG